MEIIDIKNKPDYLKEYIKLCSLEWGEPKSEEEMNEYIIRKENAINNDDKVISILGLLNNEELIGFISLFKYEDDFEDLNSLTPWYATMYIKQEHRKNGYSRLLNDAILKEASNLGYEKVYLKSELINYYEKFGAKYIKDLNNGEKLYYIDL